MEERIIPTRMELLKKQSQKKLAKKGHSLLKKKRDALIIEFFKILGKVKDLRSKLNELLKKAKLYTYYASLFHSGVEINVLANLNKAEFTLEVKEKNIMGVKIPSISYQKKQTSSFPAFLASSQLSRLAEIYGEILDVAIEIAEVETGIKRILAEIERTKRRVNALEYRVIPKIESQIKYIRLRLEELERDSFVALKVIKRRIER